jgi:hypothetical protein
MSIIDFLLTAFAAIGMGTVAILAITMVVFITWIQATE